jgi:hypothetical protein
MKIFFTARDAKDFIFHKIGEADFMIPPEPGQPPSLGTRV